MGACCRCVALLLIGAVFLQMVIAQTLNGSVVFPYRIEMPHWNATWKSGDVPAVDITAHLPNSTSINETHLMRMDYSHWAEYQGDYWETFNNWDTSDGFAAALNRTTYITSVSVITNYSTSIINEPNRVGIIYTTQLSNGAFFEFNYTINPNASESIPIPRPDPNCEIKNPQEKNLNCSCNANHTLVPETLKFSFRVTNWPFVPLIKPTDTSFLRLQSLYTAPYNLDFYTTFTDSQKLVNYEVCNVAIIPFNLTTNNKPGQVNLPFTLFNQFLKDEQPKPVYVKNDPFIFDPSTLEFGFPLGLIFEGFNHSLFYDPDFSVLIARDPTDNNNNNDGSKKHSGALGPGAITGIVIGCISFCVLVTIIIAASVMVVVYIKRRMYKRSSNIRF